VLIAALREGGKFVQQFTNSMSMLTKLYEEEPVKVKQHHFADKASMF
jgi:hypothetical protein